MAGDAPDTPKKGRNPKDSEFYEIPPNLKEDFDNLMASTPRDPGGPPKFEKATRAVRTRRKMAQYSVVFGVLGGVLLFVGPMLAIGLGIAARRRSADAGPARTGIDLAVVGILLGVLTLVINVVTLVLLSR